MAEYEEKEFEQLKSRFRKAQEYERTKYMTDTPENQDRAIKALKQIIDRMDVLWDMMSDEQRQRHMDLFE